MKIVIFGMGSSGSRYARLLLKHFNHEIHAYRSNPKGKPNPYNIHEIYSWQELDKIKPDTAVITNPTAMHIETAVRCAQSGIKLFIEKPLGSSLENIDILLETIKKQELVTYVAYNLRFHPVIQALKEYFTSYSFLHMRAYCISYLPDWHPGEDHRQSYSSNRSMGGGALLDLSHEIDYTVYLLGPLLNLNGRWQRLGDITVDTEDYADLLIETAKGPAAIHINFFSQLYKRKIDIDFKEITVIADLKENWLKEIKGDTVIQTRQFPIDSDFTYREQLNYFFRNRDNWKMMNNIPEAAELFRKLIEFKEGETAHA